MLILNYKDNNILLEEVKLQNQNKINNRKLAIMIQKEDGTGYEKSDNFPLDMIFNEDLSGCIDLNGDEIDGLIEYVAETRSLKLKSKGSSYCYLYFDTIKDDITIFISTDGTSNSIPTNGIYNPTITCNSGNVYYNPYYQRLEIGEFKRGTNCTLDYTKDTTSYTLLSSIVQSNATTNVNGYRYSGENPNNYVWFNDELWRIIGLVPACTTASNGTCSSRTNLVKLIRAESLGGFAYDAKSSGYTGLWGNNTLYTLLNSYYYGKQNGTETTYCYGYSVTAKGKCDFTNNGISSNNADYYGKMIKDIYWNIGASTYNAIPSTVYGTESAKVMSEVSKIGLMSPSDYGYAAVVSGYGTKIASYHPEAISSTNWLYEQGFEFTNIQDSSTSTSVIYLYNDGEVYSSAANNGCVVRPTVYLNENVYKISGTGTQTDPYIIGMG